MEELIKADIFFFVTTIAVALIAIGFVIALVYLVLILRALKRLTDRVEVKAEEISGDIDEIRAGVRSKARAASRVTSALSATQVARRIMNFFRDSGGKDSGRHKKRDVYEEDDDWDVSRSKEEGEKGE